MNLIGPRGVKVCFGQEWYKKLCHDLNLRPRKMFSAYSLFKGILRLMYEPGWAKRREDMLRTSNHEWTYGQKERLEIIYSLKLKKRFDMTFTLIWFNVHVNKWTDRLITKGHLQSGDLSNLCSSYNWKHLTCQMVCRNLKMQGKGHKTQKV